MIKRCMHEYHWNGKWVCSYLANDHPCPYPGHECSSRGKE